MAEFKGTKGPWFGSYDEVLAENEDGLTICEMRTGHSEAEIDANRDLIAQAPAMFALLNDLNNWLVCSCIATPEDMAQSFEAYQQEIEALLNKAIGE